MTSVSRRTFLGTAAAASVSAVAAPAMAASTSGNNLPAKWDDTVDVVVLGCGGAGMMAACQAHDAGGKLPFMTQASSLPYSYQPLRRLVHSLGFQDAEC